MLGSGTSAGATVRLPIPTGGMSLSSSSAAQPGAPLWVHLGVYPLVSGRLDSAVSVGSVSSLGFLAEGGTVVLATSVIVLSAVGWTIVLGVGVATLGTLGIGG